MYQLSGGAALTTSEVTSPTAEFANILAVIWRRRMAAVSIFVMFISLVIIATLLTPRTYTTSTKMIAGSVGGMRVNNPNDTSSLPVLNALLTLSGVQSAETYAELIQETPVAQQVINDLNLRASAGGLLSHVQVKPVTGTSILNLSVTWSDPDTSAKIANDFATVFVSRERDLIAGQAGSAMDFLSKELPAAQERMRRANAALAQYQAGHGIADINAQTQATVANVSAIETRIQQVQVDQGQAQAQLANLTGQLGGIGASINGSSSVVQNPVVSQLQQQLATVNVQLEAARKQYTDEHPTVMAFKEQKAQLEREIRSLPTTIVAGNNFVPNPIYQQVNQQATTLRAQISGDSAQLAQLRRQLSAALPSLKQLPAESMRIAELQRDAKSAEAVYTALQQKYNEAEVSKTAALSDVAITQAATPSNAAVRPDWRLNMLLGAIIGLALALSGVFVIDLFDNTFKNEEDVQRLLSLPLLASVPRLKSKGPDALPWLRALTIESFLQLVTSLRYSSDRPLRSLSITSPLQGDGKSTIALNTAVAMAEMQPRVLLIDADLRRPTLHERLGASNDTGLSDVLVGAANWQDIVTPTKFTGLDFLSSGPVAPNPVKLFQSSRFDALCKELMDKYQLVVFDTPALLPVVDAGVLAGKTDGAVLVICAGHTDIHSTKDAIKRLESLGHSNVLGIVLNQVMPGRRDNSYSHYYLGETSPLPLAERADTN